MQLSEQSSGVLFDSTTVPELPGSSVALLIWAIGSAGAASGRNTSAGSVSEAVTIGSGSLGAGAGATAGASVTVMLAGITLAAGDMIGRVLSANLASAARRG